MRAGGSRQLVPRLTAVLAGRRGGTHVPRPCVGAPDGASPHSAGARCAGHQRGVRPSPAPAPARTRAASECAASMSAPARCASERLVRKRWHTRVLPEPACSIRQLAAPHARAWPFCMGFSSGSSVGCLVWHLVLAWAGWRSELEPRERSAAQAASRALFGYTRRRKGGATKALSVALP